MTHPNPSCCFKMASCQDGHLFFYLRPNDYETFQERYQTQHLPGLYPCLIAILI